MSCPQYLETSNLERVVLGEHSLNHDISSVATFQGGRAELLPVILELLTQLRHSVS